ncbi:MAG TPA: M1 family peptidase, partial [Polyangia bacterium]|nr:M1 family peptidase [Polyangia bacterium]
MTRAALALTLLLAAPAWGATRSARLSPDVVPARYAITLAPDLAHGTFSGSETIEVTLAKPTAHITLNANGLTVGEARLVRDGAAQDAVVHTDDAQETLTLTVAHPLPAGTVQVVLGWTAMLDDNLTGFYRVETEGRPYAFTHFEPANARRAFPCFDEPGFKVPVTLTAIVDADDDVVSNAPVAETTSLPDGRKRVQFAETAP